VTALRTPLLGALEVVMPRYEFFCNACEQSFSKLPIAEEYAEDRVVCPNGAAKKSNSAQSGFIRSTTRKPPDTSRQVC